VQLAKIQVLACRKEAALRLVLFVFGFLLTASVGNVRQGYDYFIWQLTNRKKYGSAVVKLTISCLYRLGNHF
jgi:hypothetical protein